MILAAGLDGIENGLELPPEITGNLFDLTDEERAAERVGRLPGTLAEALDAMESSELVAAALGEHLFEWFLRNKRREWDRYQRHVSRFELREYLPDPLMLVAVHPEQPSAPLVEALLAAGCPPGARGRRLRRRRPGARGGLGGAGGGTGRRPHGRPVPGPAGARRRRGPGAGGGHPGPDGAPCPWRPATTSSSPPSTPANWPCACAACAPWPATSPCRT